MAVNIKRCNIFQPNHNCFAQLVNNQRVMDAGIAVEFKRLFPNMHGEYLQHCATARSESKELSGDVTYHVNKNSQGLFNLFGMVRPGLASYGALEMSLRLLHHKQMVMNIGTVYAPALGCGLGKLDFDEVFDMARDIYILGPHDLVFCLLDEN